MDRDAGAGASRVAAVTEAISSSADSQGGRSTERSADRIVWIDCEMTGLDLENDAFAVARIDEEPGELETRAQRLPGQ